MSVKVMGLVWEMSELSSSEKLVLLAYADHASHDGSGIWPAVNTIANKTSLSRRTVQRVTHDLEDKGYLIRDGSHDSGTNLWKIPVQVGGDMVTPPGVTELHPPSDMVTPEPLINHHNNKQKNNGGKPPRKRDWRLNHPAIIAYREEAHLHVPINIRDDVVAVVTDADKWQKIVHSWIGKGWNKQNIEGMLQVYRDGWRDGKAKTFDTSIFDKIRKERYGENS